MTYTGHLILGYSNPGYYCRLGRLLGSGDKKCIRNSVRRCLGKHPVENLRMIWENNFYMDFRQMVVSMLGWMKLAYNRVLQQVLV